MRWIQGDRELPNTLKKPVSLTKEGLINDFSPKGRNISMKKHTNYFNKLEVKATTRQY